MRCHSHWVGPEEASREAFKLSLFDDLDAHECNLLLICFVQYPRKIATKEENS